MFLVIPGSLEVFHSTMTKYTPKRLHFFYESMLARTQLAVLDHNYNVGREQAKTKTGNVLNTLAIGLRLPITV